MQSTEIQTAAEERTTILLNAASVPQTIDKSEVVQFGSKVLLQPYFWLMPDSGTLWTQLTELVPYFQQVGFDSMWLLPAGKTNFGGIAR